jgi:hypothetical protein
VEQAVQAVQEVEVQALPLDLEAQQEQQTQVAVVEELEVMERQVKLVVQELSFFLFQQPVILE